MNDFDGSQKLEGEEQERPTKTAPSSEMQKIQRGKKNDTAIKGILQGIMSGEDKLPCQTIDDPEIEEEEELVGGNQVLFSRTIDNIKDHSGPEQKIHLKSDF